MARISEISQETRLPQSSAVTDPKESLKELKTILSRVLYEITWRINRLVQGEFSLLQLGPPQTVEPSSDVKKDGTIAYADGTSWNPGSGKGIYYYDGTNWNLLG